MHGRGQFWHCGHHVHDMRLEWALLSSLQRDASGDGQRAATQDQAVKSGSWSLCTVEPDYDNAPVQLAVDEVLGAIGTVLNLCPRGTQWNRRQALGPGSALGQTLCLEPHLLASRSGITFVQMHMSQRKRKGSSV